MIMCKSSISFKSLPHVNILCMEKSFEVVGIYLENFGTQIINIYRSPSSDFSTFMIQLNLLLDTLNCDKTTIICGDFNVHSYSGDNNSSLLVDTFESFGFYLTTSGATRYNHCIDNFFCNYSTDRLSATTFDTGLSDHSAIVIEHPFYDPCGGYKLQLKSVRSFSTINKFNFYKKLKP